MNKADKGPTFLELLLYWLSTRETMNNTSSPLGPGKARHILSSSNLNLSHICLNKLIISSNNNKHRSNNNNHHHHKNHCSLILSPGTALRTQKYSCFPAFCRCSILFHNPITLETPTSLLDNPSLPHSYFPIPVWFTIVKFSSTVCRKISWGLIKLHIPASHWEIEIRNEGNSWH